MNTNQSREEYFEKLIDMAANYFEDDGSKDEQWKESILSETFDRIKELETPAPIDDLLKELIHEVGFDELRKKIDQAEEAEAERISENKYEGDGHFADNH